MPRKPDNVALRPDNIAAVICIAASASLLTLSLKMPKMSALLPTAMLVAMIVLSLALIARGLVGASHEKPRAGVFVSLHRFFWAISSVLGYVVAVDFIGFYTSSVIMIPAVAWIFGYRNPWRLALATVLFVGGTALIFQVGMNREFPAEFFLR